MTNGSEGTGRVIANKYRLIDVLGRGGMGSVWRAEHLVLGSHVAVKLVEPALLQHPEAMSRFLREAQAAATLRSPHVVQILDYGVDEEAPFIVMELLEGESLSSRLERVGRLSPRATADVISQVSRAIGRAHERGIVHRDLKPDNIFLTANEDTEVAKVLDFGIAKHTVAGSHGMTQTGAVLGTPYYMSPEQAEGARDVDHRSDLWALSVITYECLLGQRPFDGESIGGLILAICTRPIPVPSNQGQVPAGFDEWFLKGVSRQRDLRFTSARELAASLRRLCGLEDSGMRFHTGSMPEVVAANPGVVATPTNAIGRTSAALTIPHPDEPLTPPMNKPRLGLWLAAAALVLGAAGTVLWLSRGNAPATASAAASVVPAAELGASNAQPSVAPPTAPAVVPVPTPLPTASARPTTAPQATATPFVAPPRVVATKAQTKNSTTASKKKTSETKDSTTVRSTKQNAKVDLGI